MFIPIYLRLAGNVPPPRNEIVGYRSKWHFASGWCTPPPRNEKVGYRSKWHFGLADVPPPQNWNWTKNECYRKKTISREVIKYILPIYPPFHYHYLIPCLNRKLVNFNFKWVYGLKPHPPSLSSQKNKILIFGLRSTSDDQPGWSMDSNPIHHPSPAKNIKCSFLDYVQLLMISQAGRWTRTPSTTPLQPKK